MAWVTGFLVALAPLILLVGFLLFGRYPGERTLERCRQALVSAATTKAVRSAAASFPRFELIPVRGGRLIASSLAGRGPPAAC